MAANSFELWWKEDVLPVLKVSYKKHEILDIKEFSQLAWEAARTAAVENLPTSTDRQARDAICPHWETYNRGGSGEFGVCNCGGKISSGQTAPVA